MTTLLEREHSTAVEERIVDRQSMRPDSSPPKSRRIRTWLVSLLAIAVVASAAAVIVQSQEAAVEPLTYRAIGESEAVARFAPFVAPALTYRAIGEAEAVARFASVVEPAVTSRAFEEAATLQRFAPFVEPALSYRAIGEAEALQRFVSF